MKRTQLLLSLCAVALALGACRSSATFAGSEIGECTTDEQCAEGLRCLSGFCFQNSRPAINPLPNENIIIGDSFTVTAEATDADPDDVIVYTWTQTQGPSLLMMPIEDATLSLTPAEKGDYVFAVVATDNIAESEPVTLTVLVDNALPTVDPFPLAQVLVNTSQTFNAVADDADPAHTAALTVTWQQVSGPPVTSPDLMAGVTGTSLTFTPTELGLYRIHAVANDGIEDGPPTELMVVSQPALDVVFVKDSGEPDPMNCGGFLDPCSTMTAGLAAARGASPAIDTVLVAANEPGRVYDVCLDLDFSEVVIGGFDPETWERAPDTFRANTIFQCDGAVHSVAASALLEDVTLTAINLLDTATLSITGAPTLRNIDVEAPACGSSCYTSAIALVESDARLEGVEARAAVDGFGTVNVFTGIFVFGGAPTIVGTGSSRRSPGDGERGGVTLNTPVHNAAFGVLLARTNATVERMLVEGGLGLQLTGITVVGSTARLSQNYVGITGFGVLAAVGVRAESCVGNSGQCDCAQVGAGCPGGDPTRFEAELIASDNEVLLESAAAGGGQVPCAAFGISVESDVAGQIIDDNLIRTEGPFALSVGALLATDPTPSVFPSSTDSAAGNIIALADGRTDEFCKDLGFGDTLGTDEGLVGLGFAGAGTEVRGNTITVGAHEGVAIGLVAAKVDRVTVADNDIFVSESTSGAVSEDAIAAQLLEAGTSGLSLFERNRVAVGAHAYESAGLLVLVEPWEVTNNHIYGGTGFHTAGVLIADDSGHDDHPIFIHNTIHGGGDETFSATSTAVAYRVANDGAAGFAQNNLLDAGNAEGRRWLVNNRAGGPRLTGNVTIGNFAQFDNAAITGPRPGLILKPDTARESGDIGGVGLPSVETWEVLMVGSAELVSVAQDGSRFSEVLSIRGRDRPNVMWSGRIGQARSIVAVADTNIAISSVDSGYPEDFRYYEARGPNGAIQPSAIIAAEASGFPPRDLVMIETPSMGPNVLWYMEGAEGGYLEARPVEIIDVMGSTQTFLNPVELAAYSGARDFLVADMPNPMVGTGRIVEYPTGTTFDVDGGPGWATIENMKLVSFQEEPGNLNLRDDLMLVADGILKAFLNPDIADIEATERNIVPPACTGSSVVEYDAGRVQLGMIDTFGFVVACANRLEIYTLNGVSMNFEPLITPLAGRADAVAWNGETSQLMLARTMQNRLELHELVFTMMMGWHLQPLAGQSGPLLKDIAVLDKTGMAIPQLPNHSPDFSPLGAMSSTYLQLDDTSGPAACPLQMRVDGSGSDLHLASGGNPCVDGGTGIPAPPADDIDANALVNPTGTANSSRDMNPDIGGDEL